MKKFLLLSSFLLAVIIFFLPLYAADVVDRIVAVVNDDVITQSELEESMLPFVADYKVRYGEEDLKDKIDEARQDALNRLIEERLILQEAKKRKITVAEEEIEERLQRIRSRFRDEEEFSRTLEESGVTIQKLKQRYEEQIMMKKLVTELINIKVRITPTQIAAYYNSHKDDFITPRQVHFKVLLLKPLDGRNMQQTERLTLQLIDRIRAGEDFDSLVKQYSQGPNTEKGGDMGYMQEEGLIKEVKEALSDMEPGEVSALIKTNTGFNIVKLIDRKAPEAKSLTEVTDLIRERLFQREAELTLREFVDKLKEDAYINIR